MTAALSTNFYNYYQTRLSITKQNHSRPFQRSRWRSKTSWSILHIVITVENYEFRTKNVPLKLSIYECFLFYYMFSSANLVSDEDGSSFTFDDLLNTKRITENSLNGQRGRQLAIASEANITYRREDVVFVRLLGKLFL